MTTGPPSLSPALLLDLRSAATTALPALPGVQVVAPGPAADVHALLAATILLIAVDGEEAWTGWQQRFRPLCTPCCPAVALLDPYEPTLARRLLERGAADCCALADGERIDLTVIRLQHPAAVSGIPALRPEKVAQLLHLQATVDALPIPVFVKDLDRRYIACNKAFEEYTGFPAEMLVGRTVGDIATGENARKHDAADSELLAGGGVQALEALVCHADGTQHEAIVHKALLRDASGTPEGIVGAIVDIAERKALERELEVLAATDYLTGANNLRTFHELARHALARAARTGTELSLLVIDIDHFKEINDMLGHATGDEALRQMVAAIRTSLRGQDVFARAGGDEFRILLPDTTPTGAWQLAERIRAAARRIEVRGPQGSRSLSISCGVARCRPGEANLDAATQRADEGLYEAKAAGRDCVRPLPRAIT
jgi:diguanylate cyclase (GGDEF)-like protein/PAS domain S-box-containing protein